MPQISQSNLKYRPNVAAILQNPSGQVLVCERIGVAGAWQFPQGGVNKGESRDEALVRELGEELSLRSDDFQVLDTKGPYRYLFSNGRKKKGYDGQEQFYYLALLKAHESRINVHTEYREFQAFRWISASQFDLAWLPEFKREVYRAVLYDFFGVVK